MKTIANRWGYLHAWARFLASSLVVFCSLCAYPQSSTTTALSVLPGSSITSGTPVVLQATVDSLGTPAGGGTVRFYDGNSLLASRQVVSRGSNYPHGSATIKSFLGRGTHALRATYGGTASLRASASPVVNVDVVASSRSATVTTLSAAGPTGNYTLTGTVATFSSLAPTGPVSFVDQTNSNFLLGSANLSPASARSQWATFTPLAAAASTYGVLLEDLNGDGIPDLVSTNYGGTTISVMIGNGDGTFQPHIDYAAGTLSFGLAAADLDGDGIPDLAVASGTTNAVRVFLGNGDGTFQAATTYDTVGVAEYVVTADFNGDGILDLATCSASVASISILLGNGDGTFAAARTYGTSVFPDGLATGDFNGDGIADLAVSNKTVDTLSVFLGRGDGSFRLQVDYPTGPAPANLTVSDLNGDGFEDLIVCDSAGTSISVLLGNGNGTFQSKADYSGFAGPWDAVAMDVNRDGIPDVVVSSPVSQSVEVFQGKGDGTLLPPVVTSTGAANYLLALADLNGDGVVDLAVPQISSSEVDVSLGSISVTSVLSNVLVPGGGLHNVVASYTGDSNSLPSISTPLSLAGSPFATTATLTGSPTAGSPGQTFLFTTSISPSSSSGYTAGGTVSFFDGAFPIGSPAPVLNGSAAVSTNTLSMGTHTIMATYSGDANFLGSPATSSFTVNVISPQTIAFAQLAPVVYGVAPISLTASATSGLPVTFSLVSGSATLAGTTLTILGAGSVVIQADQAGNANYVPAPSVRQTLIANRAVSSLALSVSSSSVTIGFPVSLTATVSSASLPTPTGTITFFDGVAPLAPALVNPAGDAVYNTTSLGIGNHSITAAYSGNTNYAPGVSSALVVHVISAQTITFASLIPVTYGTAQVTLYASASSGLPVRFSLISGRASLAGSTLTIFGAGNVVVQADQAGDASNPPAAPVQRVLLVNRAAITVGLAGSMANAPPGATIDFTASVAASGPRAPTGSIAFYDRTQLLAVSALSPTASASFSTASLSLGDHFIVAYYGGDGDYLSGSTVLIQRVIGPSFSVSADPADLTVKLGAQGVSTVTIAPVGGFKGTVSLVCAGPPEIASCVVSPSTITFAGDNVAKTAQFTLKTTKIVTAAASGKTDHGAPVLAMLFPVTLFACVLARLKRPVGWRRLRSGWLVALGLLLLGFPACGGGRAGPYGKWTIVMTAATGNSALTRNANISVTITP